MPKKSKREPSSLLSLLDFFKDPAIFATTLGLMLMGFATSSVGVLVYLRKRALIGETLSHATYPGIVLCIAVFSFQFSKTPESFPLFILIGAFFSGLIGLYLVHFLEDRLKYNSDTALCFVLSTFLGFGVLLASRLQFSEPVWYQKVQALLYGQVATMLLVNVYIYAFLAAIILFFIIFGHRHLKVLNFDRDFAKIAGVSSKWFDQVTVILIVLAIVVGIRSVGVVLMAGMLIAPAAAARQFASKFWQMFLFSAIFGIGIGFFGIVFSVNGSIWLSQKYQAKYTLPTGPIVMILATLLVLFALIFAKRRGLVSRMIRRKHFQMICLEENILKFIYKSKKEVSFVELKEVMHLYSPVLYVVLMTMRFKKLITGLSLCERGRVKAKRMVRLHRLWEVYLFTCLDVQAEDVHKSAEEMEHIITPEIEEAIVKLLGDPKKDPHDQEIPE